MKDIEFDVFVTAIEGGINYWAQVQEYKHHEPGVPESGKAIDRVPLDEWYADITDTVVDWQLGPWPERHRITRKTIQDGFKVLVGETDESREANRIHPRSLHAKLSFALATVVASKGTMGGDFEDLLDADTADMIVQAGLFGEVIYG